MRKKIIAVVAMCGIMINSTVLTQAADYSDFTPEQVESEITRLEGELEILYQMRDSENKNTQETDSSKKGTGEICYTGSGDDVISIDDYGDWHVFEIEGNAEGRYFGVVAYDSNGDRIGSLVNTTDKYSGIVYDDTQDAAMLEITATGEWSVKVKSIYSCIYGVKGTEVSGKGDNVVVFYTDKGESSTATIKGNQEEHYFGVVAYDGSGSRCGSLVNTTDAYEGKVLLKNSPRIFEVTATGEWSIKFE